MRLEALINGEVIPLTDAKATFKQNEIAKVSLATPRRYVLNKDYYLADYALYRNNDLIFTGIIDDPDQIDIKDAGVVLASLQCQDELGRLAQLPGKAGALYQQIPAETVIADLLASTTTWELGDTDTVLRPSVDAYNMVSVDVRWKDTVWAQIVEVLKGVPGLYIKYAGIDSVTGKHRLDLGYYPSVAGRLDVDYHLTKAPAIKRKAARPLKAIQPYGGNGQINVLDALTLYPALATDPSYPLQNIGGVGQVVNNLVSNGARVAKNYDMVKLRSDITPTATDKAQSAYAVYLRAKRDLQERALDNIAITAEAVFSSLPDISSMIRFTGRIVERVYYPFEQLLKEVATFSIDETLRLVSYSVDLSDQKERSVGVDPNKLKQDVLRVELSKTGYLAPDADLYLASKSEEYNRNNTATPILYKGITAVLVNHNAIATDCTHPTGVAGKLFTFPMPAIPGGSTRVFPIFIHSGGGFCHRVQNPTLAPVNAIACLTGDNGASWSLSDSVTAICYYVFL